MTPTSRQNNVVKDFLDDTERHYVAKDENFAFAIGYVGYPSGEIGTNLLADETYFTINFDNTKYTRSPGLYTIENNLIELTY